MSEKTVVFYPTTGALLTRADMDQIFAQYSAADPIMVAFRQILAQRLAQATSDNIDTDLNERAAGMIAGRMQEVSEIQSELASFHAAGAELRRKRLVEKPAGKPAR